MKSVAERNELPENSTDIFYHNLVDYYHSRPYDLEPLCLYDFAQWYIKCPKPNDINKTVGRKKSLRINLLSPFADIYMRKRTKCVVIRTPKFELASDDYFYNLLMLYFPHRNETEILKNCETVYLCAKDAFMAKKDNMVLDNSCSRTFIDEIENAVRFIRCSQMELSHSLCPATFETDICNETISNISMPSSFNFCNDSELNTGNISDYDQTGDDMALQSLEVCMLSSDQISSELQKLTNCQKKVMEYVMKHFKSNAKNAFHIFISGPGGVGKSHLLRLLINWLQICTVKVIGSNPVLVCAPTGTAAKNVYGQTIHSALHLPVQHGNQPAYNTLSAKSLKKLRNNLLYVHTLIIDEISMVSSVMLEHIHKRLCAIKDNDKYFGGLNIIAVGDFFQLRPVRGHYTFQNKQLWSNLFKPFF